MTRGRKPRSFDQEAEMPLHTQEGTVEKTPILVSIMPPKSQEEKLANAAHQIWARWAQYFIDSCSTNSRGQLIAPANRIPIWKKQIETPYEHLSEVDKDKDRKIAREILAAIE